VRAFVLPENADHARFSFDQSGDAFGALRDGAVGKMAIHP